MKIYQLVFAFIYISSSLLAQQEIRSISRLSKDDNTKFTSVGNIGITITNFGTYGHGFALWPQNPSMEYPKGSGIEHIFDGGLYIGGFISNDSLGSGRLGPFVTTGAVDAASVSARGGGFEFTNDKESRIVERSSLLTSRYYKPEAVSHQDFVIEFNDTNLVWENNEPIQEHSPLGLGVHLETYAWNFPFADFFVIFNYTIKNLSNKYVDSVYVGMWTDAVVRNTKVTSPGGSAFFNKGGNGFMDSIDVAYEFDSNGDIGFTDSYLGVQFLGSDTPHDSVNYVSWQFRNTADPLFFAPQTDQERYVKLQGYFGGNTRYNAGVTPATLKSPSNRSFMISAGSFKRLAPGDSINVVFAILGAKKFGDDPAALDSDEQKKTLAANADWAKRAYSGEDKNRNNILDPGEDLNGNGKLDRYILPAPPVSPKVVAVPQNGKVSLYWDKSAELSIDPISGLKDFEGYRLYRSNAGFDFQNNANDAQALVQMAEFDSTGNSLFFNTGFNYVKLPQAVKFEGDNTEYWYKFDVDNLLNGWQYLFNVSAFDKGDPVNRIESLESSFLFNVKRIIPGTTPTSQEDVEIGVYPNPYYGNAYWDGSFERLRKIYFYNLPARAEIVIYTLAGDVIKKLDHDGNSNGSELRWFENFSPGGTQVMSGGEHAWDLISEGDQAIATGLYLFSVKDLNTGKIKTGKFLVIK